MKMDPNPQNPEKVAPRRTTPRVLFIGRTLPPRVGGIQRFSQSLCEQFETQAGARAITFRRSQYLLPYFFTKAFLQAMFAALRGQVDIFYLTDCASSPLGYVLNRLTGIPFVVSAHGLDVTFANPLYQWVMRRALRKAARVVAVSRALREECIKRGVAPERCTAIPNGINPDDFRRLDTAPSSSSGPEPVILFSIGRFVAKKGFHVFVRSVLPQLVRAVPDLEYWLAGDGPLREAILEAAREAGVEKHLRLVGKVPMNSPALWELYRRARLVVMPNIAAPGDFEGFGIVALEAAACGKLVVAYAQDGVTDAIVQGKTGFLIPPGNTELLAGRIIDFLNSPGKTAELGQKAREYAFHHFNWADIGRRYIELFEIILENSNGVADPRYGSRESKGGNNALG